MSNKRKHNQKARGRKPGSSRRSNPLMWTLVAAGVAIVAVVVVGLTQQRGAGTLGAQARGAVPAEVLDNLTQIPEETWNRVGTEGAVAPLWTVNPGVAVEDIPTVMYAGAEYCPYCASMRWSLVTALARFGEFSDLQLSRSSVQLAHPGAPTFSFYGASYSSPYVNFDPVELQSNRMTANGQFARLEDPTPKQESLLRKYNNPPYVHPQAAGSIPFLVIEERYLWSGSPFSPGILMEDDKTSDSDWARVASTLPEGEGMAAKQILANANVISATICLLNGGQPQSVCQTDAIQAAIDKLPGKNEVQAEVAQR